MLTLTFKLYLAYYGILLLTCVITGCLLVRAHWPRWCKLLVILSCVTLLEETLTFVFGRQPVFHMIMYNSWIFLETATLLYILSSEAVLLWVKRLHRILLLALPSGAVLCFIFIPLVDGFHVHAMLLYLFLELVAACSVLADILKNMSDMSDRPMHARPMFWLAMGVLFYCSIFIVIFSLGQFLRKLYYPFFWPFSVVANTFMYGGFIACFVTMRRQDRQKEMLN